MNRITRPSREDQDRMIKEVNNFAVNMTKWEIQFMESITPYFEGGGFLSEPQITHLERIYAERTP
jgi:hypothetical protein